MRFDDMHSKVAATKLAARLTEYWSVRGHAVRFWIEAIAAPREAGEPIMYAVRSDLINSLPTKRLPQALAA